MKEKLLLAFCMVGMLQACTKEPGLDPSRRPDDSYNPQLSAGNFLSDGQWLNEYVTGQEGKTYVYEGNTEDGLEHIEIGRLDANHVVLNITCGVLSEKAWINGILREQTEEYLAEDINGNLWLMGVAVDNFNASGSLINHLGSWLAGVDQAKPGIALPAQPVVGLQYRQEYYFNLAENQAEVIETGVTVTTARATFHNCIVIREWSEMEPDVQEHKFYAPAVGLIKEVDLSNGDIIELVDIR